MSLESRAAHSRDQLQALQDNEPIDDIAQLRREVEKWRDEANELEDCREALRRLGHFCGCDHVESADEREQQERHIEEAFMRIQDERDSFRDRVHKLEGAQWHDWRGVTEPDWYWWWNGDEDSGPVPVSIGSSWNGKGYDYFAMTGQLGWNRHQMVSEMEGLWCRSIAPELPKEPA